MEIFNQFQIIGFGNRPQRLEIYFSFINNNKILIYLLIILSSSDEEFEFLCVVKVFQFGHIEQEVIQNFFSFIDYLLLQISLIYYRNIHYLNLESDLEKFLTMTCLEGIGGIKQPGHLLTKASLSRSNSLYLLMISKAPSLSFPTIWYSTCFFTPSFIIEFEILICIFFLFSQKENYYKKLIAKFFFPRGLF